MGRRCAIRRLQAAVQHLPANGPAQQQQQPIAAAPAAAASAASARPKVFNPSVPNRRIVAIGGGQAADKPWVRDQIIAMTGKARPTVLYIGTPSYDRANGFERQAAAFATECGLETSHLKLTDLDSLPSAAEIEAAVGGADIIVVSGGNPLFALRRWRRLGVDELLRDAMDRGAVLCGGSCGAICWFDAGHSDALAPTTVHPDHVGPDLVEGEGAALDWSYSRVKMLGFVDAFCCPHADAFEKRANISREESYDAMLRLNPGEVGLAIDNNAAFVIEGDTWRVVSGGGKVHRKVFDNGVLRKTELRPSEQLQPLAELLELPDFLSLR